MSFRTRLRLFFALIVIVPMVALGAVLFVLAEGTELGKADAEVATAARVAQALHREQALLARPALRRVGSDAALQSAVAAGRLGAAERRARRLVRGNVVAIGLWSMDGGRLAFAGSDSAVAPATSLLRRRGGDNSALLTVSITEAGALVRRVEQVSGLEAAVFRGRRPLASTLAEATGIQSPPPDVPVDVHVDGSDFRGRTVHLDERLGAPLELAVMQSKEPFSENVATNRLLIAGMVLLFVLLALVAAAFVSRALASEIATFLQAARGLSRGDFRQRVPVEGNDEFAHLGREFNEMSVQLEAKIEEVERKRRELAETIRRVGDALATGLDRDGVVALAVRQAVDACGAQVGRALPLAHRAFTGYTTGPLAPRVVRVVEAAERRAFDVSPDVGRELLGALEGDDGDRTRRAVPAHGGDVHALSVGLRSLVDGPEYLGAISIARRGTPFSEEEKDLLEYLAGQAVVSIENASLHETVERQAVTDELTGLANVRAFVERLDHELVRSRRYDTPLALVMVDIDNFKRVNDTHGHLQGDRVLTQVGAVLRELARATDTPARYGGEELAVILPQTDAERAAQLAERMRAAVEALELPLAGGEGTLTVTASFGVAAAPESGLTRPELIAAADAALYRAKRNGKNRVEPARMALA